MTTHTLPILLGLGLITFAGCGDKSDDETGDPTVEDDTGTDDGGDEGGDDGGGDDGGGDDGGDEDITGDVSGVVTVQLYQAGDDGEREELSWEDGTDGEFIFGKIFVSAYYENDDGEQVYITQTVIDEPTTGDNEYELDIQLEGDQEVFVYAVLDYYQDSIVGSNEPKGVYPHGIDFEDGTDYDEADIEILSPIYSSGGGSCDYSSLDGDVDLTATWVDGDVYTMLLNTAGEGPLHSTVDTPTASGGGGEASYDLTTCSAYGEVNLIGAWDSNGNGMADPLDKWGTYVDDGADGNPIDVSTDLSDYTVQIPFGDGGPGISLVPFVRLSGTVNVADGTFDDLDPGTEVYVTALKYKPNGEFDITDLSIAYDADSYSWSDLTGQTEVPFTVVVPSNTVVYLWAFADSDADGEVNESGDYVASGGEESGKVATGTTNSSGIELSLSVPEI